CASATDLAVWLTANENVATSGMAMASPVPFTEIVVVAARFVPMLPMTFKPPTIRTATRAMEMAMRPRRGLQKLLGMLFIIGLLTCMTYQVYKISKDGHNGHGPDAPRNRR